MCLRRSPIPKPPLCSDLIEDLVSHRLFSAILLAITLLVHPAFAQGGSAKTPAAAAANNALTPEQAKRALDTLQDDAKRAQMIDTLRAIANVAPATTSPAPAQASQPGQPAPEQKSAIPLTADSLGAQLLLTVSEQVTDISQQVA